MSDFLPPSEDIDSDDEFSDVPLEPSAPQQQNGTIQERVPSASDDPVVKRFFERIRDGAFGVFSLKTASKWISEHTKINGANYSYLDHEFQQAIIDDPSTEKVTRKCSQIGLSEVSIREALAIGDILGDIHIMMVYPTGKFAKKIAKTRIDPVIQGSPRLKDQLNRMVDSGEMKQIGSCYYYFSGTIGQSAAISVPASLVMVDELDFCDQKVLSTYTSRMTHSPYKLWRRFSTPTLPNFGIDKHFQASRRHFNFTKCNHCNYRFIPEYYNDVKIKGWDKPLNEITAANLHEVDFHSAVLLCPNCGKAPDLGPKNREWVLENPTENYVAAGYQVSPFDAPKIISAPYLVKSSTTYDRPSDFVNFGLGLPSEDSENTFSRAELEACWYPGEAPTFGSYVQGIDAGLTMHNTIAGVTPGAVPGLNVVSMAQIPLTQFREELTKIYKRYMINQEVMDWQPYTDLLLSLQQKRKRMYGGAFSVKKGLGVFQMVDKEKDPTAMRNMERMIDINRHLALDYLMSLIRAGKLKISEAACGQYKETWLDHMMDMRRMRRLDREEEMRFVWVKSEKKQDHFHFTLLYTMIAALSKDFGTRSNPYGTLLSTFKNKTV